MDYNRRLNKEIERLQQVGLDVILNLYQNDNQWLGDIRLGVGGNIVIKIPKSYPFYPPRSYWQPNINESFVEPLKRIVYLRAEKLGLISTEQMDILEQFDHFEGIHWSPACKLIDFYTWLLALQTQLYAEPDPDEDWGLLPLVLNDKEAN